MNVVQHHALEFIPEFLETPAMKNDNWKKPKCSKTATLFVGSLCTASITKSVNKSGEKVQVF